jgi:predicted nucleic acid-binding protein
LTEAVCDAGPLIHLHEIGILEALAVFTTIHVPGAVWQEAIERHGVPGGRLLEVATIERHEIGDASAHFAERERLEHLQRGDVECLHLCATTGKSLLLTDDLAVRKVASTRGIVPVGSLGVIIRAYREGMIGRLEAEAHLEALYSQSSLFVTRTIVDLAIRRLRERTQLR